MCILQTHPVQRIHCPNRVFLDLLSGHIFFPLKIFKTENYQRRSSCIHPGAVTQVGINGVESFKEQSRSRETLECHWKQISSANHSNACLWLCPIGGQHLSRCFRDLFIRSQSETNNWMSRGTGSLRVAYQGLSRTFLKTFAAVYTHPTDRPWVSEDVLQSATCLDTT